MIETNSSLLKVARACSTALFLACATVDASSTLAHTPHRTHEQGTCAQVPRLLRAALADRAGAADVLGLDAPQFQPDANRASNGAPLRPDSAYWRLGWSGKPPPRALIVRWYQSPYISIARCFDNPEREEPLKSIVGAAASQLKPVDGEAASTLLVSYPAFNPARTQALLIYSRTFRAHLGGRTELVFLSRAAGVWKKVGSRLLVQE